MLTDAEARFRWAVEHDPIDRRLVYDVWTDLSFDEARSLRRLLNELARHTGDVGVVVHWNAKEAGRAD